MANLNLYNQSSTQSHSQLFPAARAMKPTSTSIATGKVPGVNTLIRPSVSHMHSMQHVDAQATEPVVTSATYTSAAVGVFTPPHRPNQSEEEILQQRVFAVRLMGASMSISGQILGDVNNQREFLPTDSAPIKQAPLSHVLHPSQQQDRFPNQMQQQHQLQQQQQARLDTPSALVNIQPISSLNSQATKVQQLQQFPQQQHQQQEVSLQSGFQHNQPGLATTYSVKRQQNNASKWGGNTGNENQRVKGAFGKMQETMSAWQAATTSNISAGILGAYPTSQSLSTPASNLNQQGSYYSTVDSTTMAVTSTYTTPGVASMIMPTPVIASKPAQKGFKETLQGLNPYEAEKLRKALLSGKTDSLGLTSAQALDILQALKSISSGPQIFADNDPNKSDSNWRDEISTNWPGTDNVWKDPNQTTSQSTDPNRGLATILEVLRLGKGVDDKLSQGLSSSVSNNDSMSNRKRDANNQISSEGATQLQSQTQSGHSIIRLPSKSNTTMAGLFATSMPTAVNIPFLSESLGEHAISTIDETVQILQMRKENMLKGQRSSDRQSDNLGPASKRRKTNDEGKSHIHDNRRPNQAGNRAGNADLRAGDRDRDRHSDRQRDRGRDNLRGRSRGETRTSREKEDERLRPQRYHGNGGRKRGHDSPPRRERTRSDSWHRKEHRGSSGEHRDRLNHREGSSRREESLTSKKRKADPTNSKDAATGRSSNVRPQQGVTTLSWYQHKKDALWNKKSTTEKHDLKRLSTTEQSKGRQEDDKQKREETSFQSKPALQPLMKGFTFRRSRADTGLSTSKSTPNSTPSNKTSTQPSAVKPDVKTSSDVKANDTRKTSSNIKANDIEKANTCKKKPTEKKLTSEEADKAAGAMKDTPLMNQIGESSIPHQLSLLKEIQLDEHVKNKELADWYCYVCGNFCHVWNVYITHIEGRKHKAMFQKLHEIGHRALKNVLISKLAELPDKGQGDPSKWIKVRQPKFDYQQLPHISIKSIPGDSELIYFCHRCFRTYIGSHEEHLQCAEHKKYEQMRHKCKVCNLTFLSLKYYQRHQLMPAHALAVKNAADAGKDSTDDQEDVIIIEDDDEDSGDDDEGRVSEKKKQPQHKTNKISGSEFIIPISGFFCKLCSKFYNKEKAAKNYHCSTTLHDQKVKQYYATRIKSSVASLKASPGISINETKIPSSITISNKDNHSNNKEANNKPATKSKENSSKESIPKDAPTKDTPPSVSSPKLVLSIPKMSTSNIAAIKVSSSQESNGTKVTPSQCATPETATPKTATPKTTTNTNTTTPKTVTPKPAMSKQAMPRPAIPRPTMPKLISESKTQDISIVSTTSCEASSNVTSTSSKDSTEIHEKSVKSAVMISKDETFKEEVMSQSVTPKEVSKESDTQNNQQQKSDSSETGNETDDGQEIDWMSEMPDFDNMISIDEVGESDEEGGANGLLEGNGKLSQRLRKTDYCHLQSPI